MSHSGSLRACWGVIERRGGVDYFCLCVSPVHRCSKQSEPPAPSCSFSPTDCGCSHPGALDYFRRSNPEGTLDSAGTKAFTTCSAVCGTLKTFIGSSIETCRQSFLGNSFLWQVLFKYLVASSFTENSEWDDVYGDLPLNTAGMVCSWVYVHFLFKTNFIWFYCWFVRDVFEKGLISCFIQVKCPNLNKCWNVTDKALCLLRLCQDCSHLISTHQHTNVFSS